MTRGGIQEVLLMAELLKSGMSADSAPGKDVQLIYLSYPDLNAALLFWADLKKTILFVTHSIEEAICLADRIIVMSYRPGTLKRDMLVTLPRWRDPAAPEFNALKRELGQLVMEEPQRHHHDALRMAATDGSRSSPSAPMV